MKAGSRNRLSFILDGLRYLLWMILHQQNNLEFMRSFIGSKKRCRAEPDLFHSYDVQCDGDAFSIHVVFMDDERALLFARLHRLTLR